MQLVDEARDSGLKRAFETLQRHLGLNGGLWGNSVKQRSGIWELFF